MKENYPCPTCDKQFDSKVGVSGHHVRMHGESIAKEEKQCSNCDSIEKIYPSRRKSGDRFFCSQSCKSEKLSEEYSESKLVRCESCDEHIEVPQYRLERSERTFCSVDCHNDWQAGENSYHWKGGDVKYGESWPRQREKALKRDFKQCRLCRKTQREHIEETGRELEVHHKTAIRNFDDKEYGNRLQNLITLCSSCHMEVEGNEVKL